MAEVRGAARTGQLVVEAVAWNMAFGIGARGLQLIGTLPLRPEELDNKTLIDLYPIGIVTDAFGQVLDHLQQTNYELHVARNEIRTIFDSMGAAIIVLNTEGLLEDCNRLALEWFFSNGDVAHLRGHPLRTICRCFRTCGEEKQTSQQSNEFVCEGQHFLRISSDVHDEHGVKQKRVVVLFDITRQKEAESDLRLYGEVFNHTSEGIAITDARGRFLEVNEAYCRITGYSIAELIGNTPKLLQSGRHG